MVENLIGIYFSSEININIDMKFDQALKPRIILEYTAIRIIMSSISAGVCEWSFPIFLSIFLSEICLSVHILPLISSSYSLKFHAQIAANGDSGSLDFKIFWGSSPRPPPPPCASGFHLRRSLRNSMTTCIKLASPLDFNMFFFTQLHVVQAGHMFLTLLTSFFCVYVA